MIECAKEFLKEDDVVGYFKLNKMFEVLPKKKCVETALYAAEDCVFLSKDTRLNEVIDFVKEWLVDENALYQPKVVRIASFITKESMTQRDDILVVSSVNYAINSILNNKDVNRDASRAAWSAAKSLGDERKMDEYVDYTRIFGFSDNYWKNLTNLHKMVKSLQFNNYEDLFIFFDYLDDFYPQHGLFGNLNFQIFEKIIKAETRLELVKKISSNKLAVRYLNHIYKDSIA